MKFVYCSLKLFSVFISFLGLLFLGFVDLSAQISYPQPTKAEYEARRKKESEERIKQLQKLIKDNPSEEDRFRQEIVKILIWINAPTKRILAKVGNGFSKPEKTLYFEIASLLANRGEKLEKALKFLELESKGLYIWRGNDAYFPPCLWCVEAQIRFKQNQFANVIELLEKRIANTPNLGKYQMIEDNYVGNEEFKRLALSYVQLNRIDDAIALYLRLVSEMPAPNQEQLSLLKDFYLKKYGNLRGLNEQITEKSKVWRYENFIKPYLVKNSSPNWTLTDLSGKDVKFTDFVGKIIILYFTISQFPTNLAPIKTIQNIAESNKNIVFMIIDEGYPHPLEKRKEIIGNSLNGVNVNFPILLGSQSEVSQSYKAYTGFTVLIDKKGKLRFNTGFWEPQFKEQIEFLLNDAGNK